jgi:hypothetical protein
MQAVMSVDQFEDINRCVNLRAFEKVEEFELPRHPIAIAIICSDGDIGLELESQHKERLNQLLHPFKDNGGLLALVSDRTNSGILLDHLIGEVIKASQMKDTDELDVYSHFPCGVANALHMTVRDQNDHTFSVQDRLVAGLKGKGYTFNVTTRAHVNYQNWRNSRLQAKSSRFLKDMKTYNVVREVWEKISCQFKTNPAFQIPVHVESESALAL